MSFLYTGLDATINLVVNELRDSRRKHPLWLTDPFHALAIINEEVGELNKAVLQHVYEPRKQASIEDIREEAIQAAAMAIEFIINLEHYDFNEGPVIHRTDEP